jgi:hypothetical protein
MNNTTLWTFDTEDAVKSSPVVDGGRVYVGTMGGDVLCLDAYTGRKVWSYETGGPVESSPAIVDNMVYIGSDDAFVYCLDALDGSLIWRAETGGEIKSSPVVHEGRVFLGSNDFLVYALDADDGGEEWTFETGGYVYSSPSAFGDAVYFGSCDGNVYAVNATTGEKVWNYTADFCPASPAITEDLVIFGAYDGLLHYLDRTDGREVHSVPLRFAEIYSSAGLFTYDFGDEHDLPMVFVATTGGKMVGIGPDGEEFWNRSHAAGITSSPMVVTGVEEPYDPFIVYGDEGGRLHGIEVHNPYVLRPEYVHDYVEWHVQLGTSIQSSPFMWHDRTYVGVETEEGGRVVCLGSAPSESEVFVEVFHGYPREGRVAITFIVHNLEPDRITVEFEGEVREPVEGISHAPWEDKFPPPIGDANVVYSANFTATPPEGLKPFVIRLYVDDELVHTHAGQIMCLVEGWAEVVLLVGTPTDGQVVEEGSILVASGTVSSNYTIQSLMVIWDHEWENRINITIQPNWTIALETAHLERGTHFLFFSAGDAYRGDDVTLIVHIGEPGPINGNTDGDKNTEVGTWDIVALIVLAVILVALFRTKPPRVSEKASGQ